jgi:hypothetical protein
MSKYNHYNVPHPYKDRQRTFIKWCVENIHEWEPKMKAVASFQGNKFRYYCWCEHYHSLSYGWSVCTRKHWLAGREGLEKPTDEQQEVE